MPDDIDKRSIISTVANKFADTYSSNPVTKVIMAVLEELPLIGIGKEIIDQSVTSIHKKRFNTLLDELKSGEKLLTEEVVQSEEFIHSFVVVYRAAISTYHREKIRYFGRLLMSAIEKDELASSKFEIFVRILDDLTATELQILRLLQDIEDNISYEQKVDDKAENELQRANLIWSRFEEAVQTKIGISPKLLTAYLNGLNRTGLYQTVITTYWGYSEARGNLTPMFNEFLDWMTLES